MTTSVTIKTVFHNTTYTCKTKTKTRPVLSIDRRSQTTSLIIIDMWRIDLRYHIDTSTVGNAVHLQWRSNCSEGPFYSNLGPSLSLASTFPSLPFPSSFPAQPPAAKRPPNPARGSGERCISSPAGSGAQPQPKSNLVHFSLKIRHLVATILMIFLA